ncbi:putative glutamate receptor [Nephila pilipes]|uniref:Putative glutamate receptor n=1 Tax=Nephila pilipes TaxID=299642 RepID=A0A8X6U615_NEPPI|nr:putative glutamate receptor [Nephila pilipes]
MNSKKWIIATINMSRVFEVSVTTNGDMSISGIEADLAQVILTKMKVHYDIVFPQDNEFGREKFEGNFSGLVGMVQRGEADLAIGTLGVIENRFRVVDFSFPYTADMLTFAAMKPSAQIKAFGFLNLFDFSTWVLLLGSLLLSSAVFFTMLKGTDSYFDVLHNLFGSILRQPIIIRNYAHRKKFIVGTWLLFSCVVSSIFSGILLSYLAKPSKVETIKNFRELSAAVERGTHRVYSVRGTIAVPFLLNSKERYLRLLGRTIERNGWYVPPDKIKEFLLKSSDSVVLGSRAYLMFVFGNDEFKNKVLISKDNGYIIANAFALRKGFCCSSELRSVMSRAASAGIYERFFKLECLKYWLSQQTNEGKEDKKHFLSLQDFVGVFLILVTEKLTEKLETIHSHRKKNSRNSLQPMTIRECPPCLLRTV